MRQLFLTPARLLLLTCLCAATCGAWAATRDFGDLHWRLLGPFRGGRVLAVAGVPGQPRHFYFGAVNGGVWETHDAGRSWQPIFDEQPVGAIGAIAVAPSDPNVLYVGTGEADMRSDIAQGDGVYRSRDAGRHWVKAGLGDSQQIGKIIVDPNHPDTVFVAALGHPYGPNAERGVFRSRDGGAHWQRVLGKGDDTGAIDLAFEPGNPQVIYAALWQVRRTPWNVYPPATGPGSGLYKSSDGGDTWTPMRGNGFPDHAGRIGIAVAPGDASRVYAIVDGDAGGLYRSDDAGAHWRRTSDDARIWQRGWYFGRIAVDPKNADRVYAMNTIVLRSDDGGAHFNAVQGDATGDDFHELWIDPTDPDRQILGVDQGAIVTLNGGKSWSSWHNQPTAQMYHVSTDNRFPYRVYGAQQDSGAVGLPSAATGNERITMEQFKEVTVGGESGMIAPDPRDPDIVYGGGVDRLDLRTEQTRSVDPTLAEPDALYRRTWTLPLAFSKVDPKVLYYANQRIFRTADGGEHWTPISPDLTREQPATPSNLDDTTVANNLGTGPRRGVVYAIAPSPLAAKLLWAGTDDGLVWRSRDEGAHWQDVTPAGLGAWSKVGMIEASHFDADIAYAAIDRHRLDDRKPYLYRTRDGGRSWTSIVSGIRDGDFVNAVREDPGQRGLLYAATELGVYVSFDDGDHWQPMQMNLPRTSVRDIDIHGDDMVIATHGRGFWVLDDLSPIRQMVAERSPDATRLFAPSTAIRVRPAGFTGTPLPKDEPTAQNPPFGARIDYRLADTPAQPVQLAIRDASGQLVRGYSSADKAPTYAAATAGTAPEWFTSPSVLATAPGLHRFIWPLRYPALPTAAAGDAYTEGAWAPPGRYTVELTVDGHTYRQPLTVVPDPRVKLPADTYTRQFAFARKVEAAQVRLAAAQAQATQLHTAIKAARKSPGELDAALAALDGKVVERNGHVDAVNPYNAWAMPPRSTQTFAFLAQAFGKLGNAVDGADGAPSPDAITGYDKLMPMLDATLGLWQALVSTDLAAMNAQLRGAGRPELSLVVGSSAKTP
ncbi:WD40/YVTN/BNR-like repeat-containing protein [Cognatiluteimonas profundi]|uniref:WD40/YVTN/BNR-like repeat-containing protein n=1 Tax=Cognatiluteimonas profundi TaxID=2594501 RepID=UPI0018EF0C61|nr:sialidase family protein [Lysobacter profundi]